MRVTRRGGDWPLSQAPGLVGKELVAGWVEVPFRLPKARAGVDLVDARVVVAQAPHGIRRGRERYAVGTSDRRRC